MSAGQGVSGHPPAPDAHALCPVPPYAAPTGQSVHTLVPAAGAYVPASHSWQDAAVAPTAVAKRPGGHAPAHALAPADAA